MPARQDCLLAERCLNAALALVYVVIALIAASPAGSGRPVPQAGRGASFAVADHGPAPATVPVQRTRWAGLP